MYASSPGSDPRVTPTQASPGVWPAGGRRRSRSSLQLREGVGRAGSRYLRAGSPPRGGTGRRAATGDPPCRHLTFISQKRAWRDPGDGRVTRRTRALNAAIGGSDADAPSGETQSAPSGAGVVSHITHPYQGEAERIAAHGLQEHQIMEDGKTSENPRRTTVKRVVLTVAVVVAGTGAILGGAFATFTDTTSAAPQTISSGKVVLAVGPTDDSATAATNIAPGDTIP